MSQKVLEQEIENTLIIVDQYSEMELKEVDDLPDGAFGVRIVTLDENNVHDTEIYNSMYDDGEVFEDPQDAMIWGENKFEEKFSDQF